MRIGLNGTAYDALSSGARERFLNLYGEVASRRPEIEFLIYSPREVSLGRLFGGPVAKERHSPFSPTHPLHRFLFSRGWFARRLGRDGADFLLTDHFPVLSDRTLLTIHDLRFLALPDAGTVLRRAYFRSRFARVASRARAVIAVSGAMRAEILSRLGLSPERVHVVPNGVSERFHPGDAGTLEAFRLRHGWPEEYFLALGVFERRKNLALLLRTLSRLGGESVPPLVLAGRGGPEERRLRGLAADLGLADRVLFPGYVPEEDLPAAYSGAAALLMPSRYEGFGLPVLQAFACGTPVVSSRAAALSEVAGGAAVLLSPDDEDGWCDALPEILGNAALRERLVRAGHERAAELTWGRAAEAMLEVLDGLR